MNIDLQIWISILAGVTFLLAAGLAGCFIRLSAERKRQTAVNSGREARDREIEDRFAKLELTLAGLQMEQPEDAGDSTPKSGKGFSAIHMQDRAKILKMHRFGRSTEQISRVLDVPSTQVRMLLKIQEMVLPGGRP